MSNEPVAFDLKTAQRVLKATRSVETAGLETKGRRFHNYSVEQIIVPRDGPDEDGLYTCDVYVLDDPEAGTYKKVLEDQYCRLLPGTL